MIRRFEQYFSSQKIWNMKSLTMCKNFSVCVSIHLHNVVFEQTWMRKNVTFLYTNTYMDMFTAKRIQGTRGLLDGENSRKMLAYFPYYPAIIRTFCASWSKTGKSRPNRAGKTSTFRALSRKRTRLWPGIYTHTHTHTHIHNKYHHNIHHVCKFVYTKRVYGVDRPSVTRYGSTRHTAVATTVTLPKRRQMHFAKLLQRLYKSLQPLRRANCRTSARIRDDVSMPFAAMLKRRRSKIRHCNPL